MSWISEADWRAAEPDPLGPSAADMIAHMNADHADAMVLYCKAFSKATEIASASMTGVDRYGFDMSAMTPKGPRPVRLAFGKPVSRPEEVRRSDRYGEGRQIQAGLRGTVSCRASQSQLKVLNCSRSVSMVMASRREIQRTVENFYEAIRLGRAYDKT